MNRIPPVPSESVGIIGNMRSESDSMKDATFFCRKEVTSIFRTDFAVYINQSLVNRNMTYKELSALSGVPSTTLSNYARGKVDNPNDEYCERIAAAFGDPPEVVQRMRRSALPVTAEENRLIAEADDKERVEQIAALLREHMVSVLTEFREQSAAQQTEIITHADALVAQEEKRYNDRLEVVSAQYHAEADEIRRQADEKVKMLRERADIVASERHTSCEKCQASHDRATGYLRRTVRNFSIALIALVVVSVIGLSMLGGYAFYAYHTFDRQDPTRGLYRSSETPEPEIETQIIK